MSDETTAQLKPYEDLTPQQMEALGEIATGTALPRCRSSILGVLEAKGLIHRTPDLMVGRDIFGPVTVPQYEMPISEHIAWCEWASYQDEGEGQVTDHGD